MPGQFLSSAERERLERFLCDFPGTVVLVTDDRYLLDAVATRIAAIEHGRIVKYQSGWSRYLETREQRQRAQLKHARLQQGERERQEGAAVPYHT